MKAFFVYDVKQQKDIMVVPQKDIAITVDRSVMEEFIAVEPDFSKYAGDPLNETPPEALGVIVATRESDGDVCIVEEALWQQRMLFHLVER